jgi:hypothetical protein
MDPRKCDTWCFAGTEDVRARKKKEGRRGEEK